LRYRSPATPAYNPAALAVIVRLLLCSETEREGEKNLRGVWKFSGRKPTQDSNPSGNAKINQEASASNKWERRASLQFAFPAVR
jgi:hypothetical protein